MMDEYELNSDGTADVWNFPSLANTLTLTAGLVVSVVGCRTKDKETFRINAGEVIIPHAVEGKPGLFTGVADADGEYYPGLREGVMKDCALLPAYAKRVKDIDGNYWQLSELAKGSWQAATLAKCVIQPATDTTEEKAIYLKLHTERGGDTLVFELTTDIYYSGV